jgi:ABC-type polysaccharide/polyol phosphate transport system ATPase subunit
MMASSPLVLVSSVDFNYNVFSSERTSIKNLLNLRKVDIGFTAQRHTGGKISNINLSISEGEKIGLIGHNGSGKSTLLKILAGVITPSIGTIQINTDITPLLDLGTGINHNLSCVDNIYLVGSYLGLSRKVMSELVPSILEWAELVEYANKPMKTLSTGMQSRLMFAITTSRKPKLLLIDEVLSVGDINFQSKSTRRIADLIDSGSAVVIASHDLQFIETHCSRVIWLSKGAIRLDGAPDFVVSSYKSHRAN